MVSLSRSLVLLMVCMAGCHHAAGPAAPAPTAPPSPATSTAAAAPAEAMPTLRLPGDVRPTAYRLALDIDPTQPRFSGEASIAVTLDRARQKLWLHGRGLHVTRAQVRAGGATVAAVFREAGADGMAELALAQPIGPGAATIELAWDAPFNANLVGLYKTREANIDYAFTQFEVIDARRAFPCFDEPLFKTPFDVTLTVPAADVAISNGTAVEENAVDGKKRVRFATTKPLPTYLVAFAVGPFDVVTPPPLPPNEVRHRPLQVRGIAPRGRGPELGFAVAAANELLVAEERYFGIEYPYDKLDHLAVPDFSNGAMENAGAITYREERLLYTDGKSPYSQRFDIFNTMAHEMAHQWFGDLVTLRWWTDAWLNEAFATWMASRTVEHWRPEGESGISLMRAVNNSMHVDALQASRPIRMPVKATADIWGQFDTITYQKGAAVLGMFERWLGVETFRRGISQYLSAHAFAGGSTEDLLHTLSEVAKLDVAAPFATFLEQPGVPLVEAHLACGATPALELRQSRYLPLGSNGDPAHQWKLPVCARWGSGAEAHESCVVLDEASGRLPLGGACPAWVMPNAHGSGYYRWSLGAEELSALGRNWARLDARERLSAAYNIVAAMESGTLSVADGLRALEPTAADANGVVALQPAEALDFVWSQIVAPAERPRVAAYTAQLYRPLVARLGWVPGRREPPTTRTLRRRLLEILALRMRDPEVRKQALARGHAVLDVARGELHPERIDAELMGVALGAVVQEDGARAFEAVLHIADGSNDAARRELLIRALAQVPDMARAADLLVTPRVRIGERRHVIAALALRGEPAAYFAWLQQHVDEVMAAMPEKSAAVLPGSTSRLCDGAQHDAISALFTPRVDKVPGLKRSLDQALESVQLCTAYRDRQQASATAFFAAPRRR